MTGELMTCAKIYCIRGQHEQCQARSQDRLRWILQFQLMKPNSHRYPCMRGTIDGLHDGFVCLVPRINVTFHVLQRRTSDGARVEVAHQNAPAARMHAHTHTQRQRALRAVFCASSGTVGRYFGNMQLCASKSRNWAMSRSVSNLDSSHLRCRQCVRHGASFVRGQLLKLRRSRKIFAMHCASLQWCIVFFSSYSVYK